MKPKTLDDMFNKRPVMLAVFQILPLLPTRPAFVQYPLKGMNNAIGEFFDIDGKRILLPDSLSESNCNFTVMAEAAQMVASFFEERHYPVQFRLYQNNTLEWGVFREITTLVTNAEPDYPALAYTPEEEESHREFISSSASAYTGAKRGPKPRWYKQIKAPPQALELYRLISELSTDPLAFAECHPFQGAINNRTAMPVISYQNLIHSLPRFVAAYMGLPTGKKQCATPGCTNPFHYIELNRAQLALKAREIMAQSQTPEMMNMAAQKEGDIETLAYYRDSFGVAYTYPAMRAAIPPEDMTDANLREALGLPPLTMEDSNEQ